MKNILSLLPILLTVATAAAAVAGLARLADVPAPSAVERIGVQQTEGVAAEERHAVDDRDDALEEGGRVGLRADEALVRAVVIAEPEVRQGLARRRRPRAAGRRACRRSWRPPRRGRTRPGSDVPPCRPVAARSSRTRRWRSDGSQW